MTPRQHHQARPIGTSACGAATRTEAFAYATRCWSTTGRYHASQPKAQIFVLDG
jgi:hypothetical protein